MSTDAVLLMNAKIYIWRVTDSRQAGVMARLRSGYGGALAARTAQRMRYLIDTGSYSPGDAVPSVRALAAEWGLSPATVVHAYQRLVDEGLLTNLPRIGYRVMARPADGRLDRNDRGPREPTAASIGEAQLSSTRPPASIAATWPRPMPYSAGTVLRASWRPLPARTSSHNPML